MRIEQLRQIAEIKKQRSISMAARQLYMAQPSLSTVLSNFEKEIGVQIFKRGPNGVTPTKEGEEILEMIDRILNDVDQIIHFREGQQALCGTVDLLLTKAYQPWISEILVAFKQKFPQAELNFRLLLPHEVVEEIARGSAGIGLILWDLVPGHGADALQKRHIEFEVFGEHKMVLYASPDHPLAEQTLIAPKLLADVQMVVYEPYYWEVINAQVPLHKPPLVVSDSENLKRLISLGHAVAVMPEVVAHRDLFLKHDLIVQIPIEGMFGVGREYLLYARDKKLGLLEEGLLQILRQMLAAVHVR